MSKQQETSTREVFGGFVVLAVLVALAVGAWMIFVPGPNEDAKRVAAFVEQHYGVQLRVDTLDDPNDADGLHLYQALGTETPGGKLKRYLVVTNEDDTNVLQLSHAHGFLFKPGEPIERMR